MATDFMTALRSLARQKERAARLSGRPLTETEAAAPYVASAATASDRLARSRALNIQQTEGAENRSLQERLQAERLASGEKLAGESLAESARQADLRNRIQELTLQEQQRLADAEMKAAKRAQMLGYIKTGIEAPFTIKNIYDWYRKTWPAEEAPSRLTMPETSGLGYEVAPASTEALQGLSNQAAFDAGYGAEIGAEGVWGAADTAPVYTAPAGAAAAQAASNTAAFEAGYGAEIGAEGAWGAGGSTIGQYAGPAAIVAGFLLNVNASQEGRRKTQHAREDYFNELSGPDKEQFALYGPHREANWQTGFNLATEGVNPGELWPGNPSYGGWTEADIAPMMPNWLQGGSNYIGPRGLTDRNAIRAALLDPRNWEQNGYNDLYNYLGGH